MKNVFIQTENARNFITTMKEAEKRIDKPVFLVFTGQAGRGKTEVCRYFTAQEGWVYVRARTGWGVPTAELWMMQEICKNLGVLEDQIPRRKQACFDLLDEWLTKTQSVIVIDEADKINPTLLEWIRDLADLTFTPFALVGEPLLLHKMGRERRRWRRILRAVEFKPVSSKDILFFAKQASDINLTADQAEMLREKSGGDFGLVERDMLQLEELVAVNKPGKITDDLVKAAIKRSYRGK